MTLTDKQINSRKRAAIVKKFHTIPDSDINKVRMPKRKVLVNKQGIFGTVYKMFKRK